MIFDYDTTPSGGSTSATHHSVQLPDAVAPTGHWLERVLGALFFTILAPIAFAIFMLSGLILAVGLARLL